MKQIGPIQFVLREDHEKVVKQLAWYRRAVDAFCEAECKLPMARWIHAPHYVKALFSLRTKPGKRGKA